MIILKKNVFSCRLLPYMSVKELWQREEEKIEKIGSYHLASVNLQKDLQQKVRCTDRGQHPEQLFVYLFCRLRQNQSGILVLNPWRGSSGNLTPRNQQSCLGRKCSIRRLTKIRSISPSRSSRVWENLLHRSQMKVTYIRSLDGIQINKINK